MSIKDRLSEKHILLFLKMIPYMFHEYWNFSKHVARCQMSKSSEKLLTDILMTTHAIEKAFSLHDKRKGFGVKKIASLMSNLEKYIIKYGYSEKLDVSVALVQRYLEYQRKDGFQSVVLENVVERFRNFKDLNHLDGHVFDEAGFLVRTKDDMLKLKQIDFKELAIGRYSFRHFSSEEVSDSIIKEALDIAKKSPSACNRQAYRVHVFDGEQKNKILCLQGGANSFYKEANKAVLITGNLNRYYTTEMHLPYVDGSLFAMSFIYALTSLGVASIPLTMGRKMNILKEVQTQLDIPVNEVPIILIAIGNYPDEAELSLSHRNNVDTFTTFH